MANDKSETILLLSGSRTVTGFNTDNSYKKVSRSFKRLTLKLMAA